MNAVNRVLVVILLLVAIPVCTILLVWPVPALQAIGGQVDVLIDFLNSLRWYVRLPLGILFALALDILFILLIVFEVRRPPRKAIRVQKTTGGGEVMVNVASIADGLRYEIDQLPTVLRSRSRVAGKRGGVVVELDVETAGIDVPGKAEQVVETARRVVEEKMGLKLARPPKVNLRAVPYPSTPVSPAKPEVGLPAEPEAGPEAALEGPPEG